MCDGLDMETESKGRSQQVVFYRARDETGGLIGFGGAEREAKIHSQLTCFSGWSGFPGNASRATELNISFNERVRIRKRKKIFFFLWNNGQLESLKNGASIPKRVYLLKHLR